MGKQISKKRSILTTGLIPEAGVLIVEGRSSDLLFTCAPSRLVRKQWHFTSSIVELTAPGSVTEFHSIPFSSRRAGHL